MHQDMLNKNQQFLIDRLSSAQDNLHEFKWKNDDHDHSSEESPKAQTRGS